jgi:hypothetical protein
VIQTKNIFSTLLFFSILCVGLNSNVEPQKLNFRTMTLSSKKKADLKLILRWYKNKNKSNWTMNFIKTREKYFIRILSAYPKKNSTKAILLFSGGDGTASFDIQDIESPKKKYKYKKSVRPKNNSLSRSAHLFAKEGFIAINVDVPIPITEDILIGNDAFGVGTDYRTSKKHLKDIQNIIKFYKKNGIKEFFLAGTSRGSYSVAYLATLITDPSVKGFISTASMDDIDIIDLSKIQKPFLFVHHEDDECHVTTYGSATYNYQTLSSSSKHFLTVSGGDSPEGRSCGALSEHGFIGINKKVVKNITSWMKGNKIPNRISD